ncbi:MAG: hypothetical protein FWD84_00730 [Oscillospiraceae bacterium]|nr:hypothetical protein [Oscillospiraceae bacterium]
MRKAAYRIAPASEEFFGLLVCVIFFLSGVVVGTFSARTLSEAGTLALQTSMIGYIDQITMGTYVAPGFLQTLWVTGRVHLLVLFLGFSLLGAFCLPIVAGVRGFYLSFSIAAFIRAFGTGGWLLAFSLFGVVALITVPCFFLLVSQAFSSSANLGKSAIGTGKIQVRELYGRSFRVRTALCTLGMIAAVLVEIYLVPMLVVWTSSFI